MKVRWLQVCSLLAMSLIGCEVGPNYQPPSTRVPRRFVRGLNGFSSTTMPAGTQPTQGRVNLVDWWKSIDDPELDSLVQRAVLDNPDIELAMSRLQEARTIEAIATSGALPFLDFSGGAGRGSGTNSARGRVNQPVYAGSNTTGLKEITQIYGLDGVWELDLFGKYRQAIEAAGDDTQAAAEARNAVLTAVISDVARAYLDVRALQARLAIANGNVHLQEQTVSLMQQRFDRGITNELDLALAKRELAQVQSVVPPLQSLVFAAQRRVAVLLGQFSEDLIRELNSSAPIPKIRAQIEPGMPCLLYTSPSPRD